MPSTAAGPGTAGHRDPRPRGVKAHIAARPASATGIVASLVVLAANQLGLSLSADEAVALVGAILTIANETRSILRQRNVK